MKSSSKHGETTNRCWRRLCHNLPSLSMVVQVNHRMITAVEEAIPLKVHLDRNKLPVVTTRRIHKVDHHSYEQLGIISDFFLKTPERRNPRIHPKMAHFHSPTEPSNHLNPLLSRPLTLPMIPAPEHHPHPRHLRHQIHTITDRNRPTTIPKS